VCDLETSRMGAPYIYDISRLRVNYKNIIFYFIMEQNLVSQSKVRILGQKWSGDIVPHTFQIQEEKEVNRE